MSSPPNEAWLSPQGLDSVFANSGQAGPTGILAMLNRNLWLVTTYVGKVSEWRQHEHPPTLLADFPRVFQNPTQTKGSFQAITTPPNHVLCFPIFYSFSG